ncbi:hypothetical protein ANOM_002647 [Aspergillus nomiae NRRL 13137]|uniref:Hsp70 family chaperone n=1 Tax=Aspergillus nomiae NRRL (strain ATCC 15546 / NRRL 13137 / CBS 260.88 / M93) TaxID=1509407 RepID=A0A0L1JC93_ASPN3|nr:uncharacterized protein ANOM_002647 [Aspergillus nomiae NRRL 13137]KNG89345.1 hypothetical protein ANOM_002647 [Aspergillus nomiae NRRL 13137]
MTGEDNTLIIAIEFGTTYSGIGYIHTAAGRVPSRQARSSNPLAAEKCDKRKGTNVSNDCVHYGYKLYLNILSSEILYDGNKHTIEWGFQAQGNIRALKYFTLELDPKARAKLKALRSDTESSRSFVRNHGPRSAVVGEYEPNRDAKDVCTDYLQAIYLAALEQINNLWVPAPKRFILTVPAIWTDPAKNATKQGARSAFGQRADIELIAEPQAAAIHTLSQAHMIQSVRAGNHYIICDAGGGTVDLITYCVKRKEPLELVESIPGTEEACGSIFLNRAFEDFLKVRLGRYYTGRRTETLEKWLRDARRRFDVEGLPPELYGARIHGTEETCLIITGRDVARMFDPTIVRVLSLISDQVTTLIHRRRHCPELGIVMVGGFGRSGYLYKRVKHKFEHLATVTRPPDAWASIALGALCWGMNHETVTARKLPRCYGQQVYVKYNPNCGYPSVPHPVTGEPSHEAMQWFVEASYEVGYMTIDLTEPRRSGPAPCLRSDGKGSYQKLDFRMWLLFGSEIVFRAEFEGTSQDARANYTN